MDEIENDDEVFIRSMATRGMTGGLSAKACDAADVLDAAGFDYIFIESVGIGQIELKIEKFVDTCIVVLVPESGDQVQAIKAGLMEIADIYVLNKSDRQGSANVLAILQSALAYHQHEDWSPSLVRSVAISGEGTVELFKQIEKHHQYLDKNDSLAEKRIAGISARVYDIVNETVSAALWTDERKQALAEAIPRILAGEISPKILADEIADGFTKK
jgi:LAO/AO transport system kinase